MADKKPTFSPGLVTAIVTVFFLVAFGLVIHHGQDTLNPTQPVASQTK